MIHDRARSAVQEARNPARTHIPRSERRKCTKSSANASSRRNDLMEPNCSSGLAVAHAIPMSASAKSAAGIAAAGIAMVRRRVCTSSVGMTAATQIPIKIPLADVDHGSETATAMASQSAALASRDRSNMRSKTTVSTDMVATDDNLTKADRSPICGRSISDFARVSGLVLTNNRGGILLPSPSAVILAANHTTGPHYSPHVNTTLSAVPQDRWSPLLWTSSHNLRSHIVQIASQQSG